MCCYTGKEIGIELDIDGFNGDSSDIIYFRPPNVPPDAIPVFDEEEKAIIGFRWQDPAVHEDYSKYAPYKIYNLEGEIIDRSDIFDPPIENSYIIEDILLLFTGVTEFKWLLKGGKTAVAGSSKLLSRSLFIGAGSALVTRSALTGLKVSFRILTTRQIFKFTATAASRMAQEGRYVPTHILYLAMRFGTKLPDPRGTAGLFMYKITIEVVRNGDKTKKVLEVLIRDKDLTVFHFMYK